MPETTTAKKAAAKKVTPRPDLQPPTQDELRDQARRSHPDLESALVALQAALPVVPKRHTARIPGRDGGAGYSYDYADLADVAEVAMPLLTSHGLSFICIPKRTEAGQYELQGRLAHVSREGGEGGGVVTGVLPLVGRDAQAIGSSITYGRRYLLGSMTGLVTDQDDDGSHAASLKDARMAGEPAPNDPSVYAPNGQPWRTPDGKANPDALPPHQRAVWDAIATLQGDETNRYNTWHQANQPALRGLNEAQAETCLQFIQEMVDARPPA